MMHAVKTHQSDTTNQADTLNGVYIGTSGWSFDEWKGYFYPKGTRSEDRLGYYANKFKSTEINNIFYHLPNIETIKKWYKAVPENFIFSVKASRYITHMKRLHEAEEATEQFLKRIHYLKEKTGPILFQLPPSFKVDIERLQTFLDQLPKTYRYVFEFRNDTWFNDAVYKLLEKHNASFCIYDLEGKQSPETITSDFIYIRLHGPEKKYAGAYGKRQLNKWAQKIQSWQTNQHEVFIYFDNTMKGDAVEDAELLFSLLSQ